MFETGPALTARLFTIIPHEVFQLRRWSAALLHLFKFPGRPMHFSFQSQPHAVPYTSSSSLACLYVYPATALQAISYSHFHGKRKEETEVVDVFFADCKISINNKTMLLSNT